MSYTADEVVLIALRSGEVTVDAGGGVWKHFKKQPSGINTPYNPPLRIDSPDRAGYHAVKLHRHGKAYSTSAHRIQWINTHGVIADGLEVNHKDRNKGNNALGNLEILTHAENLRHARNLKNWSARGEKQGQAKLTWDQVRYARNEVLTNGRTRVDVARELNVTATCISLVVSGKNWKDSN